VDVTSARRRPGYLLGIDAGGTVVKAVLFAPDGSTVADGYARCATEHPHPGWVERDAEAVWAACATAVSSCLVRGRRAGADAVSAVGIVGHGDGAYLVDRNGDPVRPGIAAADGRAVAEATELSTDRVLRLSGTHPFPGSPPALGRWLAQNEPRSLDRTSAWLFCKDWLRFRLTGTLGTDPTDASGAFTTPTTGEYSAELIELAGLSRWRSILPDLSASDEVVGTVTEHGARATGIPVGTPVVAGAHDVDGAAIGAGAVRPGETSLVAGTFSINQVVSTQVRVDPRWQARRFVQPGQYLAMATSPASASNLDWFLRRFGPYGDNSFAEVTADVEAVAGDTGLPVFLPFLFGAPHGVSSGGGFLGLRGEHTRAHLLRAIFLGVVCNHRMHVEALRDGFTLTGVARLTGGGARSAVWSQMFADALAVPIDIPGTDEAGALGAGVLAGLGVGMWPDLETAVDATTRTRARFEPEDAAVRGFDTVYARYLAAVDAVRSLH